MAAPAGAATDSFALSSASLAGQSSVTWQGGLGNPPATPNVWSDPITLTGQIDPSTGAISAAALSMPPVTQAPTQGQTPTYTFTEVDPGTATGTFDSTTGAVTLNDTLRLAFNIEPIGYTCDSSPIHVALSGTWDSTTQDVTLAASGFTIPQFPDSFSLPTCSGGVSSAVLAGINASPGGIAGSVGNAMSLALHGQFAPGVPTTTTLVASPNSPQLAGTSVTLTATVAPTSGSGTPTGSVTFFDNGANIGSDTLGGSDTATVTTSTLPSGTNQQLTAQYSGDTTYSSSVSDPVPYTITPLPTMAPDLPASITVPSTVGPTVSAVSPDGGPVAGGTQVTITGSGFTSGSTVDFGSTAATGVTVAGGTSITATSPKGTGTVDVTVTTSIGTSPTSSADQFFYGAPTVTAVSPHTGLSNTSLEVIITGTGFTPDASVNFGSTPANAVQVNSPTSIYAFTPTSAPAGTVDVTVTTPGGTSGTSAADQYTYSSAALPAVSKLGTPAGPAAGGTSVTITGVNFTGATAVDFGSTPAASFSVTSATSITAKSPAGTSGTAVDVTVTTPIGTSVTWPFDQFTYGPPTVAGVSPSAGPAAGGITVTITGTGFTSSVPGDTSVRFGTTKVAGDMTTVNSPTSLTVTAPAGTGTVEVTVTTTSGGTSATSAADEFTYAPTVTGVSPPSGPTSGGTAVTITGTGFTGATAVSFGSTAAMGVTVVSSTEITATSPAGTAGNANVTVTTPSGTSVTSTADQFFYGVPTVSAVSPNAGPTTGGTTVTITGTGLSGASAVKFGSTPAASFTVNSPTQLTAVSPAGSGLAHVTVTTNGGTSSASGIANDFTFNTAPSVTSLTPDTGSPDGGTGVTITGANFTAANGVYFGSTPAANVTVVSPTTITATSPAGTGAVDVTVSAAAGTSATGPGDVFAYGTPTVTNVTPSAGVTSGGTSVVITGTGFVSGTTVNFGSVAATSMTITSPTSITAVSPAQAAGAVDITVTNPASTSATSPNDVFTYSAGGPPGQASFTITNPSSGQSWGSLYMKVVLSGITSQPAANLTLSYQDSSGGWCPLTLSGTSTITAYFSGVGSSCSAPGSFSLAPGASLSVPIQLTYASGTYMGVQTVTATLYSGTCTSPTSCTQSGALDGSVVGSGTIQLAPPARLASTVTDSTAVRVTTGSIPQGFQVEVDTAVKAVAPATGTPDPTGTVEYLVDGSPVVLTSDGITPVTNPETLSSTGYGTKAFFYTTDLSPGVHTLTEEYSGDGAFAPSTLTVSFTVLPAPTGTAYTCSYNVAGENVGTGLGYVTATSPSPSPTASGSNASVSGASVSADLDPELSLGAQVLAGEGYGYIGTPSFTLSPGGSFGGIPTYSSSTTGDLLNWSSLSGAVPVTGDPGSTMPISIGSFGLSTTIPLFGSATVNCTPVSGNAPLTSVTVAGTTLTVSPSGPAAPGAPVTLSAAVAPAPASNPGTIQFYDGSSLLGSSPVSTTTGTATYTTNQLALGAHQLSAVWSGGGGLPANTSNTVDYQVGTSSTTTLASSANPANAASPVTFTATVNGSSGPSPTGDVNFTVDGNAPAACQDVALSTASPPTATCKLSLKAGTTHSVVATYSGDATYIESSSDTLSQSMLPGTTSTLTTAKNPAPASNVTFWDGVAATGGGVVPTGTVAFTVDNKSYTACAHQPLGPGGGASCTLSFKAGTTHTVYATYAGSSSYSGSKSNTISLKMNGASSSTKPKATTSGSATLASGKSLTAGQSISTGAYKLVMQADGNLVEYQGSKARWASGTSGHPGAGVAMQKDGNLVEYQGAKAIWASNTSGHAGAHLTLQGSDGNVVIYGSGGQALWSTGT